MSDLSAQMCHTLIPKLVSLAIHTEVLLLNFYCSDLSTHFTRDPFWSDLKLEALGPLDHPLSLDASINSLSLLFNTFFLLGLQDPGFWTSTRLHTTVLTQQPTSSIP